MLKGPRHTWKVIVIEGNLTYLFNMYSGYDLKNC
jgi:hypothetical protein